MTPASSSWICLYLCGWHLCLSYMGDMYERHGLFQGVPWHLFPTPHPSCEQLHMCLWTYLPFTGLRFQICNCSTPCLLADWTIMGISNILQAQVQTSILTSTAAAVALHKITNGMVIASWWCPGAFRHVSLSRWLFHSLWSNFPS